jgi:triacylglycerol lipase
MQKTVPAFLAAVLLGIVGAEAWSAPPSLPVDFPEIVRLTKAYRSMRYDELPLIHATLDPQYDDLVVVDLAATENRYMLGTLASAKRHEVWIRGTVTRKNAFTDMEFAKRRDPRLGINLHRGFLSYATAVYADIVPRLRAGYEVVIFGHSLGAAEATILGMLLSSDGWKVTRVYASGSPRVTDAEGARKFADLPVLRIINEGDPVPLLPPRTLVSPLDPYVHLGPAVLLLDGPCYCMIGEQYGDEALGPDAWRTVSASGLRADINEHFIASYLERLVPKLAGPAEVPWVDRQKYLTVHPTR